jgi:hypothetical protein
MERTGVRIAVAIQFGVQVRVRVEMQDGQRVAVANSAAQQRSRNGVVATEAQQPATSPRFCSHCFDARHVAGLAATIDVTPVAPPLVRLEVDARLAGPVHASGKQVAADGLGAPTWPAQERAVVIERNADDGDPCRDVPAPQERGRCLCTHH